MEVNILCNGGKGVANDIMGSKGFIAMSKTYVVNTHRVNGMCAHTSKDACSEGWSSPSCVWSVVEKIGEDNWKVRKTSQIIS